MDKKKYKTMRYYFYGILGMLFLMCVLVYQVVVQSLKLGNMSKEDVANTEVDVTYELANNVLETVQYYLEEDEAIQQQIDETENKYAELEIAYNKKMYLDSIVAEMDKTNGSTAYLDRYFKIEKEELQEILYKSDVSSELAAEFPGVEMWEDLLPVGEKIWLRYDGDNIFPEGIIIQNPLINVGYRDARIGMTLSDIKKLIPNSEMKMIENVWNCYYFLFEDENYFYYYIELSGYGKSTILYVKPKTRIYRKSEMQTVFFDELDNYMEQDNAQNATILTFGNNMELAAKVEKKKNELSELQRELQLLQLKYDLMTLLEEKSNGEENSLLNYEKYFRLRQGELARIEGIEALSECGAFFGFLNGHFYGPTFQVGNSILVQYSNSISIEEYLLPNTVIVTDSSANLGYMDARSGMNFEEIQENAYTKEVQEGFMYEDESKVYYIEYADAYYKYIFLSEYADGSDSWLLVSKTVDGTEESENTVLQQLYQVVLEEYDRAQQDEDYTMEKWQYIFGETAGYIGRNKKLAYCFTDFNDNDWPELIIGVQEEGEETYRPYVVYVYDSENEEIAMVLENGRYLMDIYKNGVIRLRGGYYGYDFYMYYRLNEKIDSLEWLGQFTIEETDEKKCFYRNEGDNEIEITEAEFYSQRESLEDCKAELEWRELDGFWYGE